VEVILKFPTTLQIDALSIYIFLDVYLKCVLDSWKLNGINLGLDENISLMILQLRKKVTTSFKTEEIPHFIWLKEQT
jgi:hypothetical protein